MRSDSAIAFKIVLIAIGAGLLIWGGEETLLSSNANDVPQTLSCRQLVDSGYGDNGHVAMTEFVPVTAWFVYKGRSDKGPWEYVYLPAIPTDDPWVERYDREGESATLGVPDNVRIVLKLNKVRDENHLGVLLSGESLEGTFIESISSLDSKERELLSKGYPGIDAKHLMVFEVGRKPTRASVLVLIGGVASLLAGILWLVLSRKRATPPAVTTPGPTSPVQPPALETSPLPPAAVAAPPTSPPPLPQNMPPLPNQPRGPFQR